MSPTLGISAPLPLLYITNVRLHNNFMFEGLGLNIFRLTDMEN